MPRKKKKREKKTEEFKPDKQLIEALLIIVEKMYGELARRILELIMKSKTPVGEESMGKILGVKSNEARKIVQKLAEEGIIRYRRLKREAKPGEKASGIHAWFINYERIEGILINRLRKTREKLKIRLEFLKEQGQLFICPVCGKRYTFDEALANDFTCSNDGSMLIEYDTSKEIEFLENIIKEIDKDLEKIGVVTA